MTRRFLVLGLALALGGCTAPMPGERAQAILQGTPDPDGDPSVVFLAMRTKTGGGGFCTGTVVSPHVVLTAAHCVDPSELGGAIADVRIYLGAVQGPTAVQDTRNWVVAAETHFDPDFNLDGTLTHDNGLVITSEPLPRTPVPLLLQPLADADRGRTMRLVGFGLHRYNDDLSYGSRYETTAVIRDFNDQLINYQGNAQSICNGDSGGPSLLAVDGVEHVAGVHSYGLAGCIGLAHDSRVDANLYWSAPYIDGADPGFLPPGTGTAVDLGVAAPPPPTDGGCAAAGGDPSLAGAALVLVLLLRGRRRALVTAARR